MCHGKSGHTVGSFAQFPGHSNPNVPGMDGKSVFCQILFSFFSLLV